MGTQIVAVRQGLVTSIAALSALTTPVDGQTPEVTFGYKVGSKRRQKVWTQRARFTHQPASLRASTTFRDEEGQFDVIVLVEGVGLSVEATSARAVEIGHAIEDLVATHASWPAVTGLTALKVQGDGQLLEAFNDKGSLAELTLPIRYTARLTT